jgi:hypothetical protein
MLRQRLALARGAVSAPIGPLAVQGGVPRFRPRAPIRTRRCEDFLTLGDLFTEGGKVWG